MDEVKVHERIDNIIVRMSQCLNDFETGDGATESEISDIEKNLGVSFPSDYRYFLSRFGYIVWDGTSVLGICHDVDLDEYFSMYYYTKSDRSNELPKHFMKRPENIIVVGPYGGGGHYFLYCNNSSSPGRVALLLTELSGCSDGHTWSSFSDFLNHYVYGKRAKK